MIDKLNDLIATCEKYGYMDKVINPYGHPIKIKDFVKNWKHYNICTKGSKIVIEAEFKGLEKIINHWIKSKDK